jgi:RHS repeat-associated protein
MVLEKINFFGFFFQLNVLFFLLLKNIKTFLDKKVALARGKSGVGIYQYKYNGKEWQDELNLNLYDYGARNYDPALGRWMNVDPLAEKYPNMSPYIYCANNPVLYVDPDGREFVEGKEHVQKFRSDTEALIKSKTIESIKLSNTDGSKNKIEKLKTEISELNNALTELKTLEDSDQKYSIFTNSKNISEKSDGNVEYDTKSDVLNINIRGNDIGDLSHELKHAFQFEIGQISFGKDGKVGGELYDQMDEKDAFARNQAYGSAKSFSLSNYASLNRRPNQIDFNTVRFEGGSTRKEEMINANKYSILKGHDPTQVFNGYNKHLK